MRTLYTEGAYVICYKSPAYVRNTDPTGAYQARMFAASSNLAAKLEI